MKRRVDREDYYTSAGLAEECVRFASGLLDFADYPLILEPSAGHGAFARLLPEGRRVCIDLHPGDGSVERMDFFDWQPPAGVGPILTIGNPPFGQRGALAMRFMDRACSFSQAVAFILPRIFRKHTFQDRVDRRFHLTGQFDCDRFETPEGRPLVVKSVFQVWVKGAGPREVEELPSSHGHFSLKHFHLSRTSEEDREEARRHYDFAIAQVGVNFKPKPLGEVAAGSHWFIKAHRPGVLEVFQRLDFSFLEGTNTTFMSLSKKDIIRAYEEALGRNG